MSDTDRDCPRCGGDLVEYVLDSDGRQSYVCERCGYVGIETQHESELVESESWNEALRRFREEEGEEDERASEKARDTSNDEG
ncbi:MAG: zinc ribbon domain-containing protein [Halobacteria archaeon]|nr:zinc ribbon domain-containing protein [Halobacteria archaeon]